MKKKILSKSDLQAIFSVVFEQQAELSDNFDIFPAFEEYLNDCYDDFFKGKELPSIPQLREAFLKDPLFKRKLSYFVDCVIYDMKQACQLLQDKSV